MRKHMRFELLRSVPCGLLNVEGPVRRVADGGIEFVRHHDITDETPKSDSIDAFIAALQGHAAHRRSGKSFSQSQR